jgi:hypothetical protein
LNYGRLDASGEWQAEIVAAGDEIGFYHDLALDNSGSPHFVYHNGDDSTLYYAGKNGSDWNSDVVVESGDNPFLGEENSLAIDENDLAHISYAADETVGYARQQADGSWFIDTAASSPDLVGATNIALFPSGEPAISYYDGSLKFTRQVAGSWQTELVDEGGDVGSPSIMAMDSLGRPQIVYMNFDDGSLKHSQWNLPPVIMDDSTSVFVDGFVGGNVQANDIDPDGLPLTTALLAPTNFGTLSLAENGAFAYTPNLGYRGQDSFTYEACDDNGLCGTAAVSIRVFVPTLIFIEETVWWSNVAPGSKITLRLTGAPQDTWAGVQYLNEDDIWETVKAGDGQSGWHGTLDQPGEQTWWLDPSLLDTGPYRWVIYSGQNGYTKVYSEYFNLPALNGRTLVLEGTIK